VAKRALKVIKWLLIAAFTIFITVLALHLFKPIPMQKASNCSKVAYDKDHKLLYATTNNKDIWRFKTNINKLDPLYLKMLINYEDKNFYKHFGVDLKALSRATLQYIKNGKIVSGGSTITMQLAKLLEPKQRTIINKIFEILRAFELELFYTKEQILSSYLTLAPYGGNVESINAGCWRYFAKMPSSLSASEAATLISLPQNPNLYRVANNHLATKARNKILLRALKANIITKHLYKNAIASPVSKKLYSFPRFAPHLCQKLLKKSHKVELTINKELQKKLEDWAKLRGEALLKDVTIAALVTENRSGNILAYLGSHYIFSKKTQGYVDMVNATRSPGSTLKPFIYALGFSKHLIAPLTIIDDKESVFSNYKPSNFNKVYNGEVTIAYALQHSLNVPAVKVLQRVGANSFVELLNSLATIKIPKNRASLSIALGGLGVNMMQLASYYSALANDGKSKTLHYKQNQTVKTSRFLDIKAARETNAILQNVKPPKGFIDRGVKIAFKTGTSYGFRDFWTAAYTKDYTAIVLVAKPNGKPMLKSSGRESAAPLAFEVMGLIDSIYGLKPWSYKSSDYITTPPKILKYFDKKDREIKEEFSFAYPKKSARYRSSNCKDVKVKALVKNGKAPYIWYIDGKQLQNNSAKIAHYFNTGGHTITAIDSNADIISQNIWVDKPDCVEE